ncbi:MAG: hypothetical protein HGA49_08190 [Eubacteriaceae bacterium]|nr:hypothetical protein [Eubacteriaceae bacterium]
MITVEDKIRTFSKYVYEKEVNLANKAVAETEGKYAEILEENKKSLMAKSIAQKNKMDKRIFLDAQKIISKAKMDARSLQLNLKSEIFNKFLEDIKKDLSAFTEREGYGAYLDTLMDNAKDLLNSGNYSLCMTQKDMEKFSEKARKKFPSVEVIPMNDENIGGIMLDLKTGKERIDMTLLRKMDEYKREIGIFLYEALEKQVNEIE